MKRILVLLLALAMAFTVFAACGKTPEIEPTEPVINTEDYTTEAPPETDPPEETTVPGEETEPTDETTTEAPADEPTSEGETTTTVAAVADPTTMNKTQLIQYYNDAVNLVRSGKPGYTRVEVLKINSFKSSLAGGILDGLLTSVVKSLMPGDPKTSTKNKNADNVDHFFIEQAASNVGVNDVTSITAKKEGANYVITLTLGNEVNPAKKGASKYSRVFFVQTRREVLDDLANNGLTADEANATLTYNSGKSVITVNDKGQIIKASQGFHVDAAAKQAKLSMFTFDLVADQQSDWTYSNFSW